jgi:hypothetical protein
MFTAPSYYEVFRNNAYMYVFLAYVDQIEFTNWDGSILCTKEDVQFTHFSFLDYLIITVSTICYRVKRTRIDRSKLDVVLLRICLEYQVKFGEHAGSINNSRKDLGSWKKRVELEWTQGMSFLGKQPWSSSLCDTIGKGRR